MHSHLFGDMDVAQAEKLFPLLNSLKEADLSTLDLEAKKHLAQEKQQIALTLFIAYRDGDDVVANEQVAEMYLAFYLLCPKPEQSLFDDTLFWCSWFTTLRLGCLRGTRELALLPFTSQHEHPIQFNKALQFSYILEIIVGIGKLFYYSFRPKTRADENPGLPWYTLLKERFSWERFDQIWHSSQFTNFMSNAIAWSMVNGLSLAAATWLASLGASAFVIIFIPAMIQLAGFAYDIYHDYQYANEEYLNHQGILTFVEHKNELDGNIKTILTAKALANVTASAEKMSRVVIIAVGIFIGMAMLYFLPLLGYGIAHHLSLACAGLLLSYDHGKQLTEIVKEILSTIGSTVVVVAGFLYGGLCGRLWRLSNWKESALWLRDFAISNAPALIIAALLLYFGITAAVPLVGATIVGLGVPVAFAVTFMAVKGMITLLTPLCRQIRQCLCCLPPQPSLSSDECEALHGICNTFLESVKNSQLNINNTLQENLSKNRLLLQKASGFSNSELLRHIRNWSLPAEKREASLPYQSPANLHTKLNRKFNLSSSSGKAEEESPSLQGSRPSSHCQI